MNAGRRKRLKGILERIEEIYPDLEALRDEEYEYRDNIPENLQNSLKYTRADEACDALDSAADYLSDVMDYIETAVDV